MHPRTLILPFLLIAFADLASDAVVLNPEADTFVMGGTNPDDNFNYPTGTNEAIMRVHSTSDQTVRARYAYLRFNLTNYTNIQPGGGLALTTSGWDSWDDEQIAVYGLTEADGLTPQNWDESSLTYNSTGDELIKPAALGSASLNTSDLVFLGHLPAGGALSTVTLTSPELDNFLAGRTGKRVTFILAGRQNASKEITFASREELFGVPKLTITADLNEAPSVYFIAPSGDDNNSGTIDDPWATLSYANSQVKPGDTVYIRGGTYLVPADSTDRFESNLFARVIYFDKSGTDAKPIRYWAYEDETPVFDFSQVKPDGWRVYAFAIFADWLHFKGIHVTGVQVTILTHTQSICFESNGSNNVLEELVMYENQAIGIYSTDGSNNLYLNCDAYNNWDYTSEGGRGGNVDGFGAHPGKGDTGNVFYGCRAWFNSDDGFDLINAHEVVRIENCWAFYNGYGTSFNSLGDGTGFKAGGYGSTHPSRLPSPIPRHIVHGSLAVRNKANGFYANHHPGGQDWLNNSSYRNGNNYSMLNRLMDNKTDVDGFDHNIINNVSHHPRGGDLVRIDFDRCNLSNNQFGGLSDSHFLSLDEAELVLPRKPNGELPDINFMRPVPGSPIDHIGYTHTERMDLKGPSPQSGGTEPRITIQSMLTPEYQLMVSPDLTPGSWTPLMDALQGTGKILQFNIGAATGFFYVVRIDP